MPKQKNYVYRLRISSVVSVSVRMCEFFSHFLSLIRRWIFQIPFSLYKWSDHWSRFVGLCANITKGMDGMSDDVFRIMRTRCDGDAAEDIQCKCAYACVFFCYVCSKLYVKPFMFSSIWSRQSACVVLCVNPLMNKSYVLSCCLLSYGFGISIWNNHMYIASINRVRRRRRRLCVCIACACVHQVSVWVLQRCWLYRNELMRWDECR